MKREDNLARMIRLAEGFFDTKSDPAQISISRKSMRKLRRIHPGCLKAKRDKNGPIAWVVVIPTTHELMNRFIRKKINEQQLLDQTPLRRKYDSLYLCSALVLPEHRGKGFARLLVSRAIKSIRRQHPIKQLFYWAFSAEGKGLAASVAREFNLPLHARKQR
jgi:predicted GNAT family acetyltransferase